MVEVRSAPLAREGAFPGPMSNWSWHDFRHMSSHVHHSNDLVNIPLVTTFDSIWSTPFVTELRGGYRRREEIRFPLMVQSLAQCELDCVINNDQGVNTAQCIRENAFIEYEVQEYLRIARQFGFIPPELPEQSEQSE